jgi:FkbM family methyltransferase
VRGVIHLGAHQGQEVDQYLAHGYERIVLVEPNPDACRILRERFKSRPEIEVIEAAALEECGRGDDSNPHEPKRQHRAGECARVEALQGDRSDAGNAENY